MTTRIPGVNAVLEVRADTSTSDTSGDGAITVYHRVLRYDVRGRRVAWIDVRAPLAWPVWTAQGVLEDALRSGAQRVVDLVICDARGNPLPTEEDLARPEYARRREIRDRRFAAVADLVGDPNGRILEEPHPEPLLRTVARAQGTCAANLRKWLRRYWQRGQTSLALLDDFDRCGAPGRLRTPVPGADRPKVGRRTSAVLAGHTEPWAVGVNIDAEMRDKLRRGVRFLEAGRGPAEALQETLRAEFYSRVLLGGGEVIRAPAPDFVPPTVRQFLYHIRDLWRPEAKARAENGRRYLTTRRPKLGSATWMALGPGSVYQVDATVADIYLVSQRDRTQVIGRPILYLLVDAFSRLICGLHVSLGVPSWIELASALMQAFTDKVAYCAAFGRSISHDEWPAVGVPERLMGDRGEPVRAYGNHAVRALQFACDTAAPWRADWKGLVEGKIGFLTDEAMHWAPGWVERDARTRGAPDYRRGARFTLPEFIARVIEYVLHHNNERPLLGVPLPEGYHAPRGRAPCPIDLFRWGLEHRTGALREFDLATLRAHLLPHKRVTPVRKGMRLTTGVYYTCARGEQEGWFVGRSPGRHGPKVDLVWDPRRLGDAFVRSPKGEVEPAVLCGDSLRFAEWSLNEVEDEHKRLANAEREAWTERARATAERDARVDRIEAAAAGRTKAALRAQGLRSPHVRDIKIHRGAEPKISGPPATQAGVPAAAAPDEVERVAIAKAGPQATEVPTARPSYQDLLRRAIQTPAPPAADVHPT